MKRPRGHTPKKSPRDVRPTRDPEALSLRFPEYSLAKQRYLFWVLTGAANYNRWFATLSPKGRDAETEYFFRDEDGEEITPSIIDKAERWKYIKKIERLKVLGKLRENYRAK